MMAAPAEKRVALDGLGLALVAPPSDLAWLEDFYQFEAIAPAEPPSIRVALVVDPARLAAAREGSAGAAPKPALTFSERDHLLPRWTRDGARFAFDGELEALYVMRGHTIEVVAAAVGPGRIAWMRAIRDLHERRLAAGGATLLHAAAVALGDGVVLIAGPRTAGKSTLLTWLLAQGGASYVSNDRTALLPDGRAVGIPTVITLRPGIFDHLTALPPLPASWSVPYAHRLTSDERERAARVERLDRRTLSVAPAQYCEWLGAPRRRDGRVIAVLYPEVASEPRAEPLLEPLSRPEAERRLREACISIPADGLFAELVPTAIAPPPALPALRCRLGAYPLRAARLVERLRGLAAWREEESAPFSGWDFSRLDGRATMSALPWSFEALARAALASAHDVLDVGTGGGERLATLVASASRAASIVATERYAPNLAVARARLEPLGVAVVAAARSFLPFADASFDLVLDRHAGFRATEIARVLEPGGRFITQQIDPASYTARRLAFGREPAPPRDYLAELTFACRDAGLVIDDARRAEVIRTFADVGALVYHLRAVPWIVPGFSVAGDLEVLWRLAERDEPLEFAAHFILICARRPER